MSRGISWRDREEIGSPVWWCKNCKRRHDCYPDETLNEETGKWEIMGLPSVPVKCNIFLEDPTTITAVPSAKLEVFFDAK